MKIQSAHDFFKWLLVLGIGQIVLFGATSLCFWKMFRPGQAPENAIWGLGTVSALMGQTFGVILVSTVLKLKASHWLEQKRLQRKQYKETS